MHIARDHVISSSIMCQINRYREKANCEGYYEKRDHFVHFPNFSNLKCLYLWNHSSYVLQTQHEYSYIILLHSLQIATTAHIRCRRGKRACRSRTKIAILCLTLAAHRSKQEACCSFQHWNCEVETTYKPSGKSGALEALEW